MKYFGKKHQYTDVWWNHVLRTSCVSLVYSVLIDICFRCKVPGCEVEFNTTLMLYKHFNEVHSNSSIGTNNATNANGKTGNGGSFHFTEVFQEDATAQQANFKTDFKAKHNLNDYAESDDEQAAHIANS